MDSLSQKLDNPRRLSSSLQTIPADGKLAERGRRKTFAKFSPSARHGVAAKARRRPAKPGIASADSAVLAFVMLTKRHGDLGCFIPGGGNHGTLRRHFRSLRLSGRNGFSHRHPTQGRRFEPSWKLPKLMCLIDLRAGSPDRSSAKNGRVRSVSVIRRCR